jgi:tetratricopeptide (TPR) repeat protein
MTSTQRGWLIVAIVVLGLCGVTWQIESSISNTVAALKAARIAEAARLARENASATSASGYTGKGHLFTNAEVYAFLAAAKQAELIKDPLQRCLAYPNPPGSHWTPAAVNAYCEYRMQPLMSFDELQALIQDGHAAEADQRFAQMLDAQLTQPNARGRLDRTFDQDFDGSFEEREVLDAWKRASPKSAFAYAASGFAYEKMAFKARGSGYMRDTPASNVESMDRLLQQADTDLRQAIALDARVTPAYTAMIDVGGLSLGNAYAMDAGRRGLKMDPANFSIYGALMWLAQPKWGGSLVEMNDTAARAQTHVRENPLMVLQLSKEPAYDKVNNCDCHSVGELATYPAIFDQVSTAQDMLYAAYAADSSHHMELSVVYFSEALRFDPDLPDARLHRIFNLSNFDESKWAVDEADDMVKLAPQDEDPIRARAFSYEMLGDYKHAEQDMHTALLMNPGDEGMLLELGAMYAYWTHEWDKAWDTDNRVIQAYPNNPNGWTLRAEIQEQQPRTGLQDTINYYAAHFDTSPQAHKTLLRMQAALALQSRSQGQSAPKKISSQMAPEKTPAPG